MKTVVLIMGIVLCSISSLNAQWGATQKVKGNGNSISKARETSDYEQIKVKGSLDVSLIFGTEGKINIEGESNLIPYIITKVEDDVLKIYVKKGYYLKPSTSKKLIITVPFKDINKVTLSGSGDIYSSDTIKATEFVTGVSGSGDVKLVVEAKNVKGQVSGSGDLTIKGTADSFTAGVSGSGDISAYDLKAKSASVKVTGSGDIELTATSTLTARVSGSGDIYYKGNPEKEDKKVSGSGDITKR